MQEIRVREKIKLQVLPCPLQSINSIGINIYLAKGKVKKLSFFDRGKLFLFSHHSIIPCRYPNVHKPDDDDGCGESPCQLNLPWRAIKMNRFLLDLLFNKSGRCGDCKNAAQLLTGGKLDSSQIIIARRTGSPLIDNDNISQRLCSRFGPFFSDM